MIIFLSLMCLSPQTEKSLQHDCQVLQVSVTEGLARQAVQEVCNGDASCMEHASVKKMRLIDAD